MQLEVDDAQLALSRIELGRQRNLRARNANSVQDLDQAEANFKKIDAQVVSDKASLAQAKADHDTNILAAQAKLDQAKAHLKLAEINLGYCRVFAPIDGRIGERLVTIGNLVGPASGSDFTKLATIEQLDPMGLDLYPASRYLARATNLIESGLVVHLNRPGFEGPQDHPYPGKLYFIDNTVDPSTSTFLGKATIPNPEKSLLPGEYVKANMIVGEYPKAIVIPQQAIVESQIGQTVFVVGDDDKVSIERVKTIDTYQDMSVLQEGLKPGRRVVVEGLQLVRPGMSVKTKDSTIAPPTIRKPAPGAKTSPASPGNDAKAKPDDESTKR